MKSPIARVLYIEDDADTRDLVTYVLTDRNCEVVAAKDYDEALRLARAESFDLYLLDSWLPGASGVDLCKKLREFDAQTPNARWPLVRKDTSQNPLIAIN
ncbi:MAG: response regulator [Acidobacteria bacterium]|nr:response regulator [Acidobacteriota bacterium]